VVRREDYEGLELDSRLELIRELVPLGLMHVQEELDREVVSLAGERYMRKAEEVRHYRHGTNPGTVRVLGQRLPIAVPRVRGPEGEVRLQSYDDLHRGGELNELLFRRVLYGISSRNYERTAAEIPGAIGLSSSSVSRGFVEVSAAKLREFQERDLSGLDVVALFLDGKSFAADEMVIALGVLKGGEKRFLGFVQTATENERVVSQFLRSLLDRGLDTSSGLLVVVDGSKGFLSSIRKVFRKRALVQRCQWHKRENVVSYLPKSVQASWCGRLQRAYDRPTYDEAKKELLKLRAELAEINESAARSLDDGFEETLTLHRLGLYALLGRSLKTTNILESVNSQVEDRCRQVDHWQNSSQKQRWLAAALLDIEPRLRKLVGYRHLPKLQTAIMKELKIGNAGERTRRAA
jgi:transposase-like protein